MFKLKKLLPMMLLLLLTFKVNAQEPFETKYNVDYEVSKTSDTNVTQNISILNLEKDVVATEYKLIIKKMNIEGLSANSERGGIEIEEIEKDGQTDVNLTFENTVIGEGQTNDFSISYKTKDIASKVGEIWHINIPKVNLLPNTKEYTVRLVVPLELGPEIFVAPEPLLKETSEKNNIYTFNMNTLQEAGITASFGEYQVLNFRLEYDLVNDSRFESTQTITLPPDITNMQQIAYKSINPKPERIYIDQDDNTIAEFKLKGKENINVLALGTARILSRQTTPEFGGDTYKLPKELVSKYTGSNEFWNADDPKIQNIAQTLYDPNKSVAENAQSAYVFVTSNLEYDFGILEEAELVRLGGSKALDVQSGIGCMEYTDLLISILRAMKIPARELNGYAIANEETDATPLSINLRGGDLLHSWAEYYDPEFGWVGVDPTWGSTSGIDYFTKLDTNHLALAIKGLSPYLPLPAGAFKTDIQEKQVNVDFAANPDIEAFDPKLTLYKATNTNLSAIFKKKQKFYLKNEGQIAVTYEKHKIIPTTYIPVYLPEKDLEIKVLDTLGKSYNITPNISDERLDNKFAIFIYSSLVVLVLCGMSYVLITHLQTLKKVLARLNHRLQDQDQ